MRTIVVGAGKVGYEIAKRLTEEGHDVVVVDCDEDALREVEGNLDVLTIHGNGASAAVLGQAAIDETNLFIAVTETDEVNIIACMTAKHLGVKTTVARIRNPEYQGVKTWTVSSRQLGIDLVINPEEAVAYEIVKFLRAPTATEVEYFADGRVQMVGFKVQEGSRIAGKTVSQADITSCTVGAVLRGGEVVVPHGETMLHPGDEVFIIGRTGMPTEVGWLVGRAEQSARNVVILGGGTTGLLVAQMIERHRRYGPFVKLIERDEATCEGLASTLRHALVIRGDGTNPDFLREEAIESADAFIAVTGQEQTNLLAGFMAKQAGARQVIVELYREDYIPVATQMGIDVTVIPRVTIAGTILRLVRQSNVVALSLLREGNLEVMEIRLPEASRACHKRLRHLGLPTGSIVGAVIRGDAVIVPRGDTMLLPGDHIVVFTVSAAVPLLEGYFKEQ